LDDSVSKWLPHVNTQAPYDVDASFWRVGGTVKYVVTAYGVGARVN